MISLRGSTLCIAATALAIAAGAAPSAAQERVGVNGAVKPEATGTPPGGITRRLVLGQSVVFNEHIATAAAGQTQILFLDESAMTIGPGSDLTIDQFVYDPNTGTGRLAMSATRGILRFVGGKLSKSDNAVSLHTQSATIAVRGGALLVDQDPSGRVDVYFIYGVGASVTGTDGVTQSIRRPGFAVTVSGPGSSPSPPYPTPTDALTRLLIALDGRPGGTGGTTRPPSDAAVESSGISRVISGDTAASVQAAAQSQPQPSPVPVNVGALQANLQVGTAESQATPGIALLGGNPGTATNATTAPTQISFPFAGFVEGQIGAGRSTKATSAVLQNGVLTAVASNVAVSFPLAPGTNNFGPQGTSGVFGSASGSFSGTSYLAPDDALFFAVGTSPSFPGRLGGLAGGVLTVTLPTTGTGSYSGSATGGVLNNGSTYLATGGFSNAYNFATNTGSVTISNFDGRNFSASVAGTAFSASAVTSAAKQGITLPSGNLQYTGSLAGGGLTGKVNGTFFGNAAADTGGTFSANSPSGAYRAAGVFGGSR
jgi:hypothetical protein